MKRVPYAAAAEFLGVKVTTLRSMVSRRQVPHIRLTARLVAFDLDVLDAWLRERAVGVAK